MIWKVVEIKSWKDFIENIELIKNKSMVYRGECDTDYKLESSLKREISLFEKTKRGRESIEQMMIRYENTFIEKFKSESHLYSTSNMEYDSWSKIDLLSILQHFGAPTRLLDWSYSPYIAAYFSVNDKLEKDSILYAIDMSSIQEVNKSKIEGYKKDFNIKNGEKSDIIDIGKKYADAKKRSELKGNSYTEEIILEMFKPQKMNIRIARQQGLFLVSSKIDVNYEDIISNYSIEDGKNKDGIEVAFKFIIAKEIKLEILKNLQLMNISREILFPDIEGYCKGMKYKLINDNYFDVKGEM